jgi:hypothetical protein
MPKRIKYVADINHVQEVTLRGTADLQYWTQRLAGEGLTALHVDGQAQLLLIAAEMTFKGVRFSELSFSVLVAPAAGESADCCFLVRAFNSCRLFAFSERVFFSTPYYHGDVRLASALPASIQLSMGGQTAFKAAMKADTARTPLRVDDGGWDGPVYLPRKRGSSNRSGRMFIATISGQTRTYEFQLGRDTLEIKPEVTHRGGDREILQQLVESSFVPTEWIIRDDARHAKSKTYAVGPIAAR